MNTTLRRGLLAVTLVLGLYTGIWAEFLPRQFYDSFPGLGLHFIEVDGPYNEHLVRDTGSFYLALCAVTLVAIAARGDLASRLVGVAWGVFGLLHFGYHALHPEGTALDVAAGLIALAVSATLGIVLALPVRSRASHPKELAR